MVREENIPYQIQTPDGKLHSITDRIVESLFNDYDLALLKFISEEKYAIASLGNNPQPGEKVLAVGFPNNLINPNVKGIAYKEGETWQMLPKPMKEVKTNKLSINNDGFIQRGSNITVQTVENAEGDGGEINIKTDELTLRNQSKISATSEAIGNAGDINIDSQNTISILSGSVIESLLDKNAVGNAGKIDIATGNLLIENGSISTSTLGLGNAGTITINSNILQLNNSAQIQSFSDSSGNAGDINLNVNNDFNLDNSSILASTTNQSLGEGGNINISVSNNVNLNNDALIGVNKEKTVSLRLQEREDYLLLLFNY